MAFASILAVSAFTYLLGRSKAPKPERSGEKLSTYACGERVRSSRLAIDVTLCNYLVYFMILDSAVLILAFALVACGYAIETAVVPFHMWLPDAYAAAPSSSSAFLSSIVDQTSYYVFMRVLVYILTPPLVLDWTFALAVFSALTMSAGNLFALAQNNVKRMICYVCIADIGYNLAAITSVKPLGLLGNLYFFFVGGMTTALAFMAVGLLNEIGLETLEDFSGIGRSYPATSLALVVAAFSFSGIPPLAGFIAKYIVFRRPWKQTWPGCLLWVF